MIDVSIPVIVYSFNVQKHGVLFLRFQARNFDADSGKHSPANFCDDHFSTDFVKSSPELFSLKLYSNAILNKWILGRSQLLQGVHVWMSSWSGVHLFGFLKQKLESTFRKSLRKVSVVFSYLIFLMNIFMLILINLSRLCLLLDFSMMSQIVDLLFRVANNLNLIVLIH